MRHGPLDAERRPRSGRGLTSRACRLGGLLVLVPAALRAQRGTESDISGLLITGSDAVPGAYSAPLGSAASIPAFTNMSATRSFVNAVLRLRAELASGALMAPDGTPDAALRPEPGNRKRVPVAVQSALLDVLFASGLQDAAAERAADHLVAGLAPAGTPVAHAAAARTLVELLRGLGTRGARARPEYFNTAIAVQLQLAVRAMDALVVGSSDEYLVRPPAEFLAVRAALYELTHP